MEVMAIWTGERADALRQALRMTNESFAGRLGVAVRTVAYWRERPSVVPRPAMQEILDVALAQASTSVQAQFALILAERGRPETGPSPTAPQADDLASLARWITASNAGDPVIEAIDQAIDHLASRHTQAPPRQLLADVLHVHGQTLDLLRSGRQRLRQTRELVRIDGSALAHASVLLGDLGQDQEARSYGRAATLLLEEADASQAIAMYALAKTARWQHDYATAADVARQGFRHGPVDPMSVQLAYYEANCAALLGDRRYRAREALIRADQIAQALPATGGGRVSLVIPGRAAGRLPPVSAPAYRRSRWSAGRGDSSRGRLACR